MFVVVVCCCCCCCCDDDDSSGGGGGCGGGGGENSQKWHKSILHLCVLVHLSVGVCIFNQPAKDTGSAAQATSRGSNRCGCGGGWNGRK